MKLSKRSTFTSFITLILALLVTPIISASAAPLLAKNQSGYVHQVTVTTPNNQVVDVQETDYFGKLSNGSCNYEKTFRPAGPMPMGPGVYGLTSNGIKEIAGDGFTCAKLEFTYKQTVVDTYQLIWDGKAKQYTGSIPYASTMNIQ